MDTSARESAALRLSLIVIGVRMEGGTLQGMLSAGLPLRSTLCLGI